MRIITNNHWRQFKYRYEVPDHILESEFDWTTEEDIDGFFCYRGIWYHLSEFMRFGYPGPFGQTDERGYHGYHSDSFFSGVLIRMSDDGEEYQIATYIA